MIKSTKILRFLSGFLMIAFAALAYIHAPLSLFEIAAGSNIAFAFLPLIELNSDKGDNLAGVRKAYVIPIEDIETFPDLDADKTNLTGNFGLVADKFFTPMYSTKNKGNLTFETEGEMDFEAFKIGGNLFYPSTNEQSMQMSNALNGRDVVVVVEEISDNGFFVVVGTKKLPARLKPSGDWGSKIGDEKGINFAIESFSRYTPSIYKGTVPLALDNVIS